MSVVRDQNKFSTDNTIPSVPNKSLVSYLCSIPFIIVFVGTLVGFDILQRLFGFLSKNLHEKITYTLNCAVLWCLKLTGLRINVNGQAPDKPGPYLLVCNHQSLMDIPIVTSLFGHHNPRFISKQELTKWLPFVSYNLRTLGHAIINRGNKSQALTEIKRVAEHVRTTKTAIVLFPEGTRARDGVLKNYKPGGFIGILNTIPEATIIPITIEGSWKIAYFKLLPVPFGVEVKVVIGAPIENQKEQEPIEILAGIRETSAQIIQNQREERH